jgi:lysophospholipase L1-like esterase
VQPEQSRDLKVLFRQAAVYLAIIVATVVGAESLARIFDWQPRAWDGSAGDGMGALRYYHSPSGLGDLVPNQNGLWVIMFHRPYNVQTNSVGFRNTEEPSASAFQILAVGDSQTFGPYLANEDTWPAWSEAYLAEHYHNAASVRVFNAGIAGYTILDELAYLREKGIHLKPNLVILGVVENDINDLRKEKNGVVQRPHDDVQSQAIIWLKALVRDSALFSVAERIKSRMQLAAAGVDIRRGEPNATRPALGLPDDHDKLARRYGELFHETVGLLKSQGIPLAVIFLPTADNVARAAPSETEPTIRALTAETATPYLDLTPVIRAQTDAPERLYLLQQKNGALTGNSHMSREGHAVVGRALVEWLIANKLVPP